jgi:hypothetical protein
MKNSMKRVIVLAAVIGLFINVTPAFAASRKAKEEARRECRQRFGGTSELYRVDKKNGYAYCRTGYRVEKFPFRWPKVKKDKILEQPIQTYNPPAVERVETPSILVPCHDCEGKLRQEPAPILGKVELRRTEDTTSASTRPEMPVAHPTLPATSEETITKPTRDELIARYGRGLFEQAETICVKRSGSGSMVEFIDEKSWQVVCSDRSEP